MPQFDFATVFVAVEQGLFAKHGIEVNITHTPNSVFLMKNLIEGKFDLTVTAMDNLVAYLEEQRAATGRVRMELQGGGSEGTGYREGLFTVKAGAELDGEVREAIERLRDERQVLRVEDMLHDIQGVVGNVDLFGSGCIHQGFTFLLGGRDSRPANER